LNSADDEITSAEEADVANQQCYYRFVSSTATGELEVSLVEE